MSGKKLSFDPNAAVFVPGGAPAPAPAPAPEPAPAPTPEPAPAKNEDEELTAELDAQLEELGGKDERKQEETSGGGGGGGAPAPAPAPEPADTKDDDYDDDDDDDEGTNKYDDDGEAGDEDPREHLNLVFIGHVDAGKSTLSGNILYLTGNVDKRTIDKFEKEAKQRNRDSWFLAYIMDTNEEERSKGKTVEVGRAHFNTDAKRYTILDAPGHKSYVPNMISGASQADIGVLVISARKGEFETGFERGGQTREHALLAKTLGVRGLIVVVNKMDDPTVEWDEERYNECVDKLTPFLKQSGYKKVTFIPISGLSGANVKDRYPECTWYKGPSLVETLDALQVGGRDPTGPIRIPVLDRFNDRGTMIIGKVESGTLRVGDKLTIIPTSKSCKIDSIYIEDVKVSSAKPGENISVRLSGVNDKEVQKGFVLCSKDRPLTAVKTIKAQLMVMDLGTTGLMTAGYKCMFHCHTLDEECWIEKLLFEVDKKTGKPKRTPCAFVRQGAIVTLILEVPQTMAVDTFKNHQQLGRFTLRDEGRTVAIGKILELNPKFQVNHQ